MRGTRWRGAFSKAAEFGLHILQTTRRVSGRVGNWDRTALDEKVE
jgi:hypothetical protein